MECLVEARFPNRVERFRLKIVKRMNLMEKRIKPVFVGKKKNVLTKLWVGKSVTNVEVERFIRTYFVGRGLWKYVTRFQLT